MDIEVHNDHVGAKIRSYQPGEERVLYDICLLTGDSGVDASGLYRDPSLLGEVYVGPYLRFAPSFAWVGVDAQGVAGGGSTPSPGATTSSPRRRAFLSTAATAC